MPLPKQQHQAEVIASLQAHFSIQNWSISLPHGSGAETYFAHANGQNLFIKLGAHVESYQTLAALGLTPPVLVAGYLEDGTSLMVQPKIAARIPTRKDFHANLERFAAMIRIMHTSEELKRTLPGDPSESYRQAGLQSLERIQQKWDHHKVSVPAVAGFVDEALRHLRQRIMGFTGAGLAACHNDPCNANWLVARSGEIYLIDFDSLALEDPALDLGAILWWYYPTELRPRFLEISGYAWEEGLRERMKVRMALHCLDILLPRERSFDRFDPAAFGSALIDFRAALAGEENPQGYED